MISALSGPRFRSSSAGRFVSDAGMGDNGALVRHLPEGDAAFDTDNR